MSLEGSLETIALPEVLQLLSDTTKSGELSVRGDRGEGRLWFDGGRLSGFDVARCSDPADALFELLRQSSGRFSFDAGTDRPESANAVAEDGGDVLPILEVAQAHLDEWTGIVAVVPSLDHGVSLSSDAPSDDVSLTAAQWSLVVTIGEGRTVASVLDRAGLSEFEGCRSLKTLVEAGLASVAEPEVVAEPEPVFEEPVLEPEAMVASEPEPVDEPVAEFASLSDAESASLASFEVEAQPVEEPPAFEEPQVVVNGGEFDGHDFVFKAPAQSEADGYEPQPVPYPETHQNGHVDQGVYDAEADEQGSMSSRAALEALLAEIPEEENAEAPAAYEGGEVHDGLADRGPWTSQELASFDHMGGWSDEQAEAAAPAGAHEYDFSHVEEHAEATAAPEYHFEETHGAYAEASDEVDEAAGDHAEASEDEQEEPQPEHVNRGLLLKFLSSVRS